MTSLEVLFAPAEFAALKQRSLSDTVCVVLDVLRATSTMVSALANGAAGVVPVEEITEALAFRSGHPGVLLAGEREGVRICAPGAEFDLGNSPREFTPAAIARRTIVTTTTNGTRALRACAGARTVLAASFLNLGATAAFLDHQQPTSLLIVCSGTHEETAFEDALAAGALCDQLWDIYSGGAIADSALLARNIWRLEQSHLLQAVSRSRNGRRLLSLPDLKADVAFCVQRDLFNLVAELGPDGVVRRRQQ